MLIETITETAKNARFAGADYDTQLTIQWLSPVRVNLKNLSGTFTREFRRELADYLRKKGVQHVTYTRVRNGQWVTFDVDLTDAG
jgi:hypothetical protein